MPDLANKDITDRLEQIELQIRHLDSRDRMRMIGGTIRSLINVGFLIFAIWTSWYLLTNMDEIIRTMATEAAKQSQQMMKGGSEDLLKQMQNMLR